jgi:hypothetical protein
MNMKNKFIICPSCQQQMKSIQRSIIRKTRLFACACGHRRWVSEDEFEVITDRCFICFKNDCCAGDHRFKGELIGMGF